MPSASRSTRAAAFAFAGMAAAFVLYYGFFGMPQCSGPAGAGGPARPAQAEPSPKQSEENVKAAWAALKMNTPGSGPADANPIASADSTLNHLIRTAPGLDEPMQKTLIAKVGEEVRARCGTADEYLAFADHDTTTRWLGPTDTHEWQVVDGWWDFAFKSAAPRGDSRDLLSKYLAEVHGRFKPRLVGFSDTPDGVRLLSFTVRAKDEVYVRAGDMLDKLGKGERDRWIRSNSGAPIPFRVPKRDLPAILSERGVAQVAMVMMVVQTEGGVRYNWVCLHVWDPQRGAWFTDSESRRGWEAAPFWY